MRASSIGFRPPAPRSPPYACADARAYTHAEAAEWAKKAQICFNECVNSLGPHWALLQRDDVQTCEALQETGLLQALQLYNLMYGGKTLAMGISRESPPLLSRPFASPPPPSPSVSAPADPRPRPRPQSSSR